VVPIYNVNAWIIAVIGAAILGGCGQIALKVGAARWNLLALGVGVLLYGIVTIIYILALRRLPLSVAYPLISISYVVAVIGAATILGERIDTAKIIGITLILAGVTTIAR